MWVSRGQAQNAADAGALAGAISLAFDNPDRFRRRARRGRLPWPARTGSGARRRTSRRADVTFPPCPPGAPGCAGHVREGGRVPQSGAGGNPLPTFFRRLVGVANQGVRATATAQVVAGDSDRLPEAVGDSGQVAGPQGQPAGHRSGREDDFERYVQNGSNVGGAHSGGLSRWDLRGIDGPARGLPARRACGTTAPIPEARQPEPGDQSRAGISRSSSIRLEGPGGNNYQDNIARCDPTVIGPGSELRGRRPGNMIGPTNHGIRGLIAQDAGADWIAGGNGAGRPVGGCMTAGTCGISPRLVAIAVFDPAYVPGGAGAAARNRGRTRCWGSDPGQCRGE